LGFIIQPTKWDGSDWLKLGLLGAGTFLGFGLIKNFEPVTLFILAPGALLTMGILIGIVIFRFIRNHLKKSKKTHLVIFSAKGKQFNQKIAYDWAKKYNRIILIAGRYEGIDERVKTILKADEISIGPYVLTDGDVAAMVVISAVSRLVPGVIKLESLEEESHWNLLLKKEAQVPEGKGLEYPHYTRPEVIKYKNKKYSVPKVLLSGNHKKIEEWRKWHQK